MRDNHIDGFVLLAASAIVTGIAIMLAVNITGIPWRYSDGERTGVVVKLSKRGIVWKTWEGQMNVGSMSSDGNGMAVPATWEFSVADETVVKQIQAAAREASRITLHYSEPLVQPWSEGSSGYLVTGVDTNR